MSFPEHYSAAESRDPELRERELLSALPDFIAHAKKNSPAFAESLRDADPREITTRAALAELPAVNKSDLIGLQEKNPPFGGFGAMAAEGDGPLRAFLSPGPIAECDFGGADGRGRWKTAPAFHAAGFRRGMIVHNSFSYHFTPAGLMCESGALELGCAVFPAGTESAERQARALERLRAAAYCGPPDFLSALLDRADEIGADVSPLKFASVSGGYLSPEIRGRCEARGIRVLQWYGTAELGAAAFESAAGGAMILSEGILAEVVDPLSRRPLPAGEKGELLVTNFNRGWPLVRFSPGDLTALVAGASPCGRTNARVAGWLGRCDPAVKARGMLVHPAQVARLAARLGGVAAAQLIVRRDGGRDILILKCAPRPAEPEAEPALRDEIAAAFREETRLRAEVEFTDSAEAPLIRDER